MRKLTILLLLTLTACKKAPQEVQVGMKFNYIWQKYGNRPWVGKEPAQPFTVDSLDNHGYGDYWVSNSEGMRFTLEVEAIREGM